MWLRGKINIALALCIGAPLALGFASVWYGAAETMRQSGARELDNATRTVTATIEDRAGQDFSHLMAWSKLSVMQDVLLGDDSGEIARTLENFKAQYPDFAALTVTDEQGDVVATTAKDGKTTNVATDEGFNVAASGRAYQSSLSVHPSATKETIWFTVPLIARHDGQTVIGTLTGVLDFGAILKASIAPSLLSASGNAVILKKKNGQIVYATNTDVTLLDAIRDVQTSGELSWHGEPYFVATSISKKKALPQDLDLVAEGVAPAKDVLAATTALSNRFLAVGGLATLAAFWLAWRWTTPLVELGNALEALARGNVLYRGPRTKPTDAFAPMAQAFEILRQMRIVRDKIGAREADLRRAKEHAETALKAKSEHLATLSHALSEQLSTIVRLSDLINREALDALKGETRSAYAQDIAKTGAKLMSVLHDLFDLSEVEAGHVTLSDADTDLTALVREACERMQQAAFDAQVTLGRDGIDEPLMVRCDATKIKQVMANLLSNAVKFTPAGGLVTVHLRVSANGCPVVAIEDTGIGMPANLTPAATAADTAGHGAGLGLPLARQLVDLHGGRLDIESEEGVGTTVAVTLPAARLIATPDERKIA